MHYSRTGQYTQGRQVVVTDGWQGVEEAETVEQRDGEHGDALQRSVTAAADPTRGLILMELAQTEEMTPTQIARRLGVPPNNVYHHMRVLLRLDVVDPPRAVPGETYVEKYYRLKPEVRRLLRRDPEWIDRALAEMTGEERKALAISMCLGQIHLLQQAIRRYQSMDTETFDRIAYQEQLSMSSVTRLDRASYKRFLAALRDLAVSEHATLAKTSESKAATDVVLISALPMLWDDQASDGALTKD